MRILLPVVTATLLAASPSFAQDFYGQVFGGINIVSDPTFSGDVATPAGVGPQSVETDQDTGFNFGIAVGTSLPALGSNFRGEVELSYSRSDVDGVAFSGNGPDPEVNVSGDISTTRVFGNLLYDFEKTGKFTPFVGAGLGLAHTDINVIYGPGVNLTDTSTDVSAQLILGAAYELSDGLSLVGDVRYIRDFGVESARFNPAGAVTGTVEDDIGSFNVNVGLRFNF